MSDMMINGASVAVATAATTGIGYAASASYLPKTVLNFLGRSAFQLPHYAGIGFLATAAYEATQYALTRFNALQEKVKDEKGVEKTQTSLVGKAVGVLTGLAVGAAAGYGLVAAGLVAGVATQAAVVGGVLAAVALAVHFAAKAIFSALFGKEETVVTPPVKTVESQKKVVDEQKKVKEDQDKVIASLQAKVDFANAKKTADEKEAAFKAAQTKHDAHVALIQKLNDDVTTAEAALAGKVRADLVTAHTNAVGAPNARTALTDAVTAAGADAAKLDTANKALKAYDEAVANADKAVKEYDAAAVALVAAKAAHSHADTGVAKLNTLTADLNKAMVDAQKAHTDAAKAFVDMQVKNVDVKLAAVAPKLKAAQDVQIENVKKLKDAEDELKKLEDAAVKK